MLNIVRNLSFDEINSTVLAQNEACHRLLLLAAHAQWGCLSQLAYDALSNLASEVTFAPKMLGYDVQLHTLVKSVAIGY